MLPYSRGDDGTAAQAKVWRRFGWRNLVLVAVAISLVQVLLLRNRSRSREERPTEVLPDNPATHASAPAPLSFETDPDTSKTIYCAEPHNPKSPLVQYALVIDFGPTKSTIHIHKFNHCNALPRFEYEVVFKNTFPSIYTHINDPLHGAETLDVLLDEAAKAVPEDLHGCTPITMKAFGVLTIYRAAQVTELAKQIELRVRERYNFSLPEHDLVSILDDEQRGVYKWVTANYLLGALWDSQGGTHATVDLGEEYTQIIFDVSDVALPAIERKHSLTLGARKYEVYQHTYKGYGVRNARAHVHRDVAYRLALHPASQNLRYPENLPNPCIVRRQHQDVEIYDEDTGSNWSVRMDGKEIGSFEECDRLVEPFLTPHVVCEVAPCAFGGVYQPPIRSGGVFLMGLFNEDFGSLLPPPSLPRYSPLVPIKTVASTAKTVCEGVEAWKAIPHWQYDTNWNLRAALERSPELCLDLTYMHSLLTVGYGFEDDRSVKVGKMVRNTTVDWPLGVAIEMVSGGNAECRSKV